MATTLLLDTENWDLTLDASGNIALASEPYAQLQDVASECRVFAGECWYDTTRGVPYFESVLGELAPVPVIKEQLAAAAKLVPGVTEATVYITSLSGRAISGQVQTNVGTATV